MVQLTNNHWAIQVPDDAQELDISHGRLIWVTRDSVGYETLTEGSWQYLFTTKGATEEDARKVVEKVDQHFWKCYGGNRPHISELQSLRCLLQEKQCDFNRFNFAIIQNNTNNDTE